MGWWTAAPYVAMVVAEFLDVGLTTLGKAATGRGMNHFIFVLYSNALASILLFILSSRLFQRTMAPPLSLPILCRFFLLGLAGITIMQNCVFTGISYSSPTLGSAMANLIPAFTFMLALLFRIEEVDIRSASGQAKFLGTLISISGALVVILYKGPAIVVLRSQYNEYKQDGLQSELFHLNSLLVQNWVIGGLFLAAASLSVSIWINYQAATVRVYPSEMTIVLYNCLFGTIQCSVVCLIAVKEPSSWILRSDMELISVVYSAVFGNCVTMGVQTWCAHKKGPTFVAMFKPVGIAIAAFMSAVFLGETLHFGSVVGAIVIAAGFYCVIWGKAKEENTKNSEACGTPSNKRLPLLHGREA